MGLETGIFGLKLGEEIADIARFDIDGGGATGGGFERPPQHDVDHQAAALAFEAFLSAFSSSALRMRGGDIGICVMRTPAALETALAIAARGGTIEVSPTPRTP